MVDEGVSIVEADTELVVGWGVAVDVDGVVRTSIVVVARLAEVVEPGCRRVVGEGRGSASVVVEPTSDVVGRARSNAPPLPSLGGGSVRDPEEVVDPDSSVSKASESGAFGAEPHPLRNNAAVRIAPGIRAAVFERDRRSRRLGATEVTIMGFCNGNET